MCPELAELSAAEKEGREREKEREKTMEKQVELVVGSCDIGYK